MQGNKFSCPIPQDMAYLNVTCQNETISDTTQPANAPNTANLQTGQASIENANTQQCDSPSKPSIASACRCTMRLEMKPFDH